MKTIKKRSLMLAFVVFFFCIGLLTLFVRLFSNCNSWTSVPYNAHLTDENGEPKFGYVFDRNGKTVYSPENYYEPSLKEPMLHTLGDLYGNISTGVFSMYTSKISGYNFVTGFSELFSKKTKTFLTVDSEVSKYAYDLLGYRKGAVFIYNYQTGEVICDVSTPTYDPLNIPEDIDSNSFYEGAYLDKNYSASFTPGSTFKVVTAICAIENLPNYESITFNCEGALDFGGDKVTCLEAHGELDIKGALMHSCNCAFGQLAVTLGKEKLTKTANSLGFNSSFPFEKTSTAKSVFDVTEASQSELAWSGIGQYTVITNPYHMALIMGAVAGNGRSAKPYVLRKITSVFDIPVHSSFKENSQLSMKYSTAKAIKQMLRNNVENYYGDWLFPDMQVCAKTGTAEVGSNKADTAWIIGFSDSPFTPYAFAVAVEEGGFGYQTAAPIASELLKMLKKD